MRIDEIKNEIDEIKKREDIITPNELKYEAGRYKYGSQQCEVIRSFGECIYSRKISIREADTDQTHLLENIKKINHKSRPKTKEGKNKKRNTFDSVSALYEDRELTLNVFRSGIFPIKEKQGKRLKILTPKQMLQRLPKSLAQVKAGNTFENLLNDFRQIMYSLYRAITKKITKKVYNNIRNSIKL